MPGPSSATSIRSVSPSSTEPVMVTWTPRPFLDWAAFRIKLWNACLRRDSSPGEEETPRNDDPER